MLDLGDMSASWRASTILILMLLVLLIESLMIELW